MNKILRVDVMIEDGEKFYCTLSYPYSRDSKFDFDALAMFVLKKCPTLKYRNDVVLICDGKKTNRL